MKYIIPALIWLSLSFTTYAQQGYTDSIRTFQGQYIKDLYAIIKSDTVHIRFFPVKPAFRVQAKVSLLQDQPVFKLTTSFSD